jgi:hypothetical protein
VDIVTNSFSKINVNVGPRIENLIKLLKNLQFPTIGFTEKTSLIKDGGNDAIKNHENSAQTKSADPNKDQASVKQYEVNKINFIKFFLWQNLIFIELDIIS